MATGDDERAGEATSATVHDRPGSTPFAPDRESSPALETHNPTEPTVQMSETAIAKRATPAVGSPMVQRSAARPSTGLHSVAESTPVPRTGMRSGTMMPTTAVDALRHEEIDRTRLFIRLGWLLSVLAIATVPFLDAPTWMNATFIGSLIFGMIVSIAFHQSFANPDNYSDRALMKLAVLCVGNASVAVFYFGVFTACPGIIVIGIHFAARTEAVRTARAILSIATVAYLVSSVPIITGLVDDPGVFASDRELSFVVQLCGVVFVLASYVLAYVTARALRQVSLRSIEDLQRATRIASQREALMEELRADLERALRIGGPGRYTDQQVGSFQLGIVLGRGAMGEVYEAAHVVTNEPAAVKLLRRELLNDPTQVARFLREAKATSALDSPHVVKILEVSTEGAELPYLAMELLHGTTLSEILRAQEKLSALEVMQLVRQVGSAIDAAARIGVVHRDLKPQNLYRIGEMASVWKVLDFGVASLSEDTGTLTQGGIVGTPNYMAPEQAQGRRVDARADVYALAAVAYRALTGRHPFTAADTPAVLYAVVHKMPARPRELAEELPEDVDRWFAIALAKNPDERFQSGDNLAEMLHLALTSGLDSKLRKRADALIKKMPWD